MGEKAEATAKRFPLGEAPQSTHVAELVAYFNEYEAAVGVKSLHREGIPLRQRSRHRVRYTLSDGNSRAPTGIIDERNDDPADVSAQQPRGRGRRRRPLADSAPDMNDGLTARPRGGTAVSPNPSSYDKLAEIVPLLSASKRVYRALRWMSENGQGLYVTVLWRLYGAHWWGKHTVFGPLAPIVTYTQAADEARDELALDLSTARETNAAISTRTMHAIKREEIEATFWMAAGTMLEAESDIDVAHGLEAEATIRLDRLAEEEPSTDSARARHAKSTAHWRKRLDSARRRAETAHNKIAASREFMGRLLEAYAYDGVLRARLGAITSADRETSHDDAISWKLRAPPPYLTTEEKVAWVNAREHFKSTVRVQADQLRRAAHEAYRHARSVTR